MGICEIVNKIADTKDVIIDGPVKIEGILTKEEYTDLVRFLTIVAEDVKQSETLPGREDPPMLEINTRDLSIKAPISYLPLVEHLLPRYDDRDRRLEELLYRYMEIAPELDRRDRRTKDEKEGHGLEWKR